VRRELLRERGDMVPNLSAGTGMKTVRQQEQGQTPREHPPGYLALRLAPKHRKQSLGRQVFWLSAHRGPWTAFPGACVTQAPSGIVVRTWPITAAAPHRIRTCFPIVLFPQ
jgi:hypothetical protein